MTRPLDAALIAPMTDDGPLARALIPDANELCMRREDRRYPSPPRKALAEARYHDWLAERECQRKRSTER